MSGLVDSASRLLGERWRHATILQTGTTRASASARLGLDDGTVFVKRTFDLGDAAREAAALRFLNATPSPIPLAPHLIAAEDGLLVMEDLGAGEGPNTGDLLMGHDPEAAYAALVEHARLLAVLRGATAGRYAEYARLRGFRPAPEPFAEPWPDGGDAPISDDALLARAGHYRAVLLSLGVCPRRSLEEEIVDLGRRTEGTATARWAFGKGDQNMAGDYVRKGGVPRLMDFGSGGFRPALYEGMPERMTWGCTMALPPEAKAAFAAAYRQEMRARPGHVDDSEMVAEAGARWNVFHTLERLPSALEGDRPRGPTSLRQQTVAWLRAFVEGEGLERYPELARGAGDVLLALRSRWSDDAFRLPFWPAFATFR